MFKDTINYKDFNGTDKTMTVYFNISIPELIDMDINADGGLGTYLTNIVNSEDNAKIMEEFTKLIVKSYGIKSEDGNRFIKSEEITKEFMESEAYTEFFFKLISDADYAVKFANGIMPDQKKLQMLTNAGNSSNILQSA